MTQLSLTNRKFFENKKDKKAFVYLSMLIALLFQPLVFDAWILSVACLQSLGCSILVWVWWVLAIESMAWFFEQCDNDNKTEVKNENT